MYLRLTTRRTAYRERLGLIHHGPVVPPKKTAGDYLRSNLGFIQMGQNYVVEARGPLAFLQTHIRRAGLRLSPIDITIMCMLCFFAVGLVLQFAFDSTMLATVAALWAMVVPLVALKIKGTYRLRRVEEQLADAVDMIVAALHAGVALRAGMELVRQEMKSPIREEFNDLLTRIDFGVPAPQAFKEWSRLLNSRMIDLFAISMAAKWDVGGNMSDMLLNLGRRIRESIRLRRRVETLTAEARFSMILAYCAPYALAIFFWVMVPNHIETLFSNPTGLMLVQGAIVLQVIALPVAFWMLRIDY